MSKLLALIAVLLAGGGLYTGTPLGSSAPAQLFAEAKAENPPPAIAQTAAPQLVPAPALVPAQPAAAKASPSAPADQAAAPPTPPQSPAGTAPAVPAPAADKQQDATTLDSAVNGWKTSLAKQKGFEAWGKATWTSSPLGPGTHGWVIILKQGSDEVGYMVVFASEDGTYRLGEYGTGKQPLFSLATLYRTLVQHDLIDISFAQFMQSPELHGERLYYNPMQAVWKVQAKSQTHLIDAKTGELLPIKPAVLPQADNSGESVVTKTKSSHRLIERLELPVFDPFEKLPWVKGKPLNVQSFDELKQLIAEKQKITCVSYLYGYEVTVPLAVTGYHSWSEDNYVLMDQDGLRAVHYEALPASSRFYR